MKTFIKTCIKQSMYKLSQKQHTQHKNYTTMIGEVNREHIMWKSLGNYSKLKSDDQLASEIAAKRNSELVTCIMIKKLVECQR